MTDQEAFDELALYTLSHPDPAFIHQVAVDAFAAHYADESTKPIKVAFAVAGLYLHLEKGFTGKEAQRAHMALVHNKAAIPKFDLPLSRGSMRVQDVLEAPPGAARDQAIIEWSRSVWAAWSDARPTLEGWLAVELGI